MLHLLTVYRCTCLDVFYDQIVYVHETFRRDGGGFKGIGGCATWAISVHGLKLGRQQPLHSQFGMLFKAVCHLP